MPRLPTRKRRNHRHQKGGDATDTIIQSILRDGNVAIDRFFQQEDVEEVVERIIKKDNLPLADAIRVLHRIFIGAITTDNISIVIMMLNDERVDAAAKNNEAITLAIFYNHADIVVELLKDSRVDPANNHNFPIRHASEEGFLEIVEELMRDSRVDPSAEGNAPLLLATQNNHEEVVVALLKDPRVDPSVDDNQAIQYAAENKNLELISIFYCDYPNVSNNKNILEMAREGKYAENVNAYILRLYSDSPEKVCAVHIESEERFVDISENTLVYTPNMTSYNFIENEEVPIRTELCRRDNILIKVTNSFFTLSRSDIAKNLKTHTHTRFECSGEMIPGSFIYSKDVVVNIPYYYIQGIGNFLVTNEQLISAMNTYSIIELVKSGKHIPVLTSYGVVQGEPGRLLDGTPMQDGAYMSADHCQAGTEQNVYDIYGIILS